MSDDIKEQSPQQRWTQEIDAAEKELKKFYERGRRVTKKFLDERDSLSAQSKWFNVFYANTNILESSLYSQMPKPSVTRRYKDYDDDIARVGAVILQRSITQDLDDPRDTFDTTMRHCVQDRLVPGLGQAWLRLETDFDESTESGKIDEMMPENQPDMEVEPLKTIRDQRVCVDYVFWEDFLWSPCRVWAERRWVARRVEMDRKELIERFGEKKVRMIGMASNPGGVGRKMVEGSTPKHDTLKKYQVYEIWERATRKVYWFSKEAPMLLDEEDDPLGLVGFEPCPTPMLANISTSNCTPRPDYYMIQDQYTELDNVNNRISMLVQACKVVGVYDKSAVGVARMMKEGFDNELIPVDNWAMFAEKGGLKGQIDWLPLDVIVAALRELNGAREVIKGQIYELTGISDIVRGASKASETLGAQEIKSQFASIRIKKLQDEVARFASEVMRIKAEIQIKHFEPEIILKRANAASLGTDQEFIPQAMELLKTEEGFEWRVQVTADSIAQADYAMEKADRIEFLTAISGFLEKTAMMPPATAPLMVSLLKWGVAGFRNSAEIEGMLDKELDQLTKQPPKQEGPSPEQMKMELEGQKLQAQMQMDQQKLAMQAQAEQQKLALETQKMQLQTELDTQKMQMEMQKATLEAQKLELEMQMEEMRIGFEMKKLETEAEKSAQESIIKAKEMEQAELEANRAHALAVTEHEDKIALERDKLALDAKIAEDKCALDEKKMVQDAQVARETAKASVDASAQLKEPITKLTEAIGKPKKVVRDKDGRASGVE
jgi:hypothetical protein